MHASFLPIMTVVECVCACECVCFVQTPPARLKKKKRRHPSRVRGASLLPQVTFTDFERPLLRFVEIRPLLFFLNIQSLRMFADTFRRLCTENAGDII